MLSRTLLLRALRHGPVTGRIMRTPIRPHAIAPSHIRTASHVTPDVVRWMSGKTAVDEKVEEIAELYATAQDEFEIAMEETTKVSVYAEGDRKAAREELTKLQEAYRGIIEGSDEELATRVKHCVGQRIRELEQGVAAMEELALNQD